jgi:hypothetical protein
VQNKTSNSNRIDDLSSRVKLYEIAKGLIARPTGRFHFKGERCPWDDAIKRIYSVMLFQSSELLMADLQTTLLKTSNTNVEQLKRYRGQ